MNRRVVVRSLGGLAAIGALNGSYKLGTELVEASANNCGWRKIVFAAAFPSRDSGRMFSLGKRLYLSNGYQWGNHALRDLWYTIDGEEWLCANANTPYESYSPIMSLSGSIYAVMKGMWKSDDGGVTWGRLLRQLPFEVTVDSPIVVVGGVLTLITATAVWNYNEAINSWKRVGSTPGAPRYIPKARLFRNALYLIGGCDFTKPNVPREKGYTDYTTKNDVWRSIDGGANWTLIVPSLPSKPRMWPTVCVHNGALYMMGGYNNVTGEGNFRDTFVTADGEHWHELAVCREFTERHAPNSFSLNGKLYIAAGNANPNGRPMRDIWRLEIPEPGPLRRPTSAVEKEFG